jgi:anhydro-N-acetylmuramic acid kinase
MSSSYFIGLMSGTSLDGADGVLARMDDSGHLQVLAHDFVPFDATFRSELLALNQSGPDELHRSALVGNAIARHYAEVVGVLLQKTGLQTAQVNAIGATPFN